MWESVALTMAGAAGNNIGKVIRAYALNRLWISGFLMDMCDASLMLTALSQAPVSVVQPSAGCGLAILCVFSHFYLKEVINGLDWVAITLAGLGTIDSGSQAWEGQSSDDQDDVEYPFEDADLDDGLDPAMQEELDREVEDFARRLNSVWPERRHLGQERRIESHDWW